MSFVNPGPLVQRAREEGYAVPAFNSNGGNYDIARASLEAADEMRSPVILQVYEPNCTYRGFAYVANLCRFLCEELAITVPVALQLDHGHSLESVLQAMRAGFTGVMFDASHEPLRENIDRTREVVRAAKAFGAAVEAEIGYVKGNEPKPQKQIGRVSVPEKPAMEPVFTDLAEARTFVESVEVSMLAVSVGTTHGVYQSQTDVNFDLLTTLRDALPVPLVQHGTCGISLEDLGRLARNGMAKINFGEPFRYDYIRSFTELTDQMEHLWHPWRIQEATKERLKAYMQEIITAIGSAGKAE